MMRKVIGALGMVVIFLAAPRLGTAQVPEVGGAGPVEIQSVGASQGNSAQGVAQALENACQLSFFQRLASSCKERQKKLVAGLPGSFWRNLDSKGVFLLLNDEKIEVDVRYQILRSLPTSTWAKLTQQETIDAIAYACPYADLITDFMYGCAQKQRIVFAVLPDSFWGNLDGNSVFLLTKKVTLAGHIDLMKMLPHSVWVRMTKGELETVRRHMDYAAELTYAKEHWLVAHPGEKI